MSHSNTTTTIILMILCITAAANAFSCPIYLTISLAGKTLQDSCLEINWGPDCHSQPEWIGIFREDPSITNLHPEIRFTNITGMGGKFLTNLKIGKLRFPKGWNRKDEMITPTEFPKGKCLSYYVASFNGNELFTVECLKIQPNWMSKSQYIAEIPLKNLFIPGTHASGAYFNSLAKIKSPMMREYMVSQHFDIWTQLIFGIRYLDLSIGFQTLDKFDTNDPDNFWAVNENMFANRLRDILRDVKRFVQLSREVVILDFSSFPIGFYKHPERHSDLLHLLNQEIGDLIYNKHQAPSKSCDQLSANEIRKTNKYIIILYPLQELPYPENESNILCPSWKRFSTGFMNTTQSLEYMRLLFSKKPDSPVQDEGWIFQAIQSFEQSLNSKKLRTTKERADHINPICNWLRGPWGQTANVVAMDYFTNTNIIDVAIYANLQKAFSLANKDYVQFEILSD